MLPFLIVQLIVPVVAYCLGKQFLALIAVSQKTINSPLVSIPITVLAIWHAYFTNCVASLFYKIHKFNEVPVEIAVAEGEGDLTLEYWRKVHGELYVPYLKTWSLKNISEATVITEFFEIVYR